VEHGHLGSAAHWTAWAQGQPYLSAMLTVQLAKTRLAQVPDLAHPKEEEGAALEARWAALALLEEVPVLVEAQEPTEPLQAPTMGAQGTLVLAVLEVTMPLLGLAA